MAMKKGIWDTILKVIIAVASAVLGALALCHCFLREAWHRLISSSKRK